MKENVAGMEVMVVAYGGLGDLALATLSRSTPIYELAVNDLARKYSYNGSLQLSLNFGSWEKMIRDLS